MAYYFPYTAYMISSVKDRHRRIIFIIYLFILRSAVGHLTATSLDILTSDFACMGGEP